MNTDTEHFEKQLDCIYKDQKYSVRDNGAVLRHARQGRSIRKQDNRWMFGTPNSQGYLMIASEVVHRIVAFAFHGQPPTPQHIVDHIDTNRKNNRPENLRWLTKLENILNNPITVKRIIFRCGSIETFLLNPSILKDYVNDDPNFGWMKTVTPEEAEISWKRLNSWSTRKKVEAPIKKGVLGEWVFQNNRTINLNEETSNLIASKTQNAVQKNWKTPCEFPFCPQAITGNPIIAYANNLKIGEVFSRNQYSNAIIINFALSIDKSRLWIICKSTADSAMKPWTLAQVHFEDKLFIHSGLGSFFKQEGVDKQFTLVQGFEWYGGDTYDDLVS